MRRQEKYPETRYFHYYNANPHNRLSGDCVIRAICTALSQTWEQTLKEMTEIGMKYGYLANDTAVIDRYLDSKGWGKCKQPRKSDNTKYTGKEWCRKLQDFVSPKRMIANIGGHHIVAIIDGKVNDIWDSTDGCIGNYWVKRG